jgi:hypothetical protein
MVFPTTTIVLSNAMTRRVTYGTPAPAHAANDNREPLADSLSSVTQLLTPGTTFCLLSHADIKRH